MLKPTLVLACAVSLASLSPRTSHVQEQRVTARQITHSATAVDTPTVATSKGAQVGTAAPPLEVTTWLNSPDWLKTPAPAPLALDDGHVYVLDFTGWWCAACPDNYPPLTELAHTYSAQGVRVILVTAFDGQDLKYMQEDFQKSKNTERAMFGMEPPPPVTLPIIIGGKPADTDSTQIFRSVNVRRYGASMMPMVVVVDQHGIIRFKKFGLVKDDNLPVLIDSLLKPSATKP